MGMLGLECLSYLAKFKKTAPKLLLASQHPQYGFSLAITSINITAVLVNLMTEGLLRNYFYYMSCHGGTSLLSMTDMYELHCALLDEFVAYYQEQQPESIMEFNIHKDAWADILRARLRSFEPCIELVE